MIIMKIKEVLKTKSILYEIIKWKKYEILSILSDKKYANYLYKKTVSKTLNLDNPKTFDEKLWYLKLNYRNPLMTQCTDKYKVREYVKKCGLGHILNELYGVYNNANEIDFNSFSENRVFFKCNHTSGYNAIYDKTEPFDKTKFIKKFNYILTKNHFLLSREWNYKNIDPKIICEKMLPQNTTSTNHYKELIDYRFVCFNGKVKLVFVDIDTCAEDGSHKINAMRNVYNEEFEYIDVKVSREQFDPNIINKPNSFDTMKEYAEILAEPFPFCRVDLYEINGKIYFGEMTFYHAAACNEIEPIEWDYKMGSWINIEDSRVRFNVKQTEV